MRYENKRLPRSNWAYETLGSLEAANFIAQMATGPGDGGYSYLDRHSNLREIFRTAASIGYTRAHCILLTLALLPMDRTGFNRITLWDVLSCQFSMRHVQPYRSSTVVTERNSTDTAESPRSDSQDGQ